MVKDSYYFVSEHLKIIFFGEDSNASFINTVYKRIHLY